MNKKAFSLIELIVGITISMLLMVSVGVFISSGMQNIIAGQKVLENTEEFTSFEGYLNNSIYLIQSGSFLPINTGSGIIFKRGQFYGDGGFSYIGTDTFDEVYCNIDSQNSKTNNLYIKSFIPFEEQGEDIFTDYTGSLSSIAIIVGGKIYRSFQKENKIAIKNGTNWDTAVGKTIFGDKFTEGSNGTDIYLNSPTGLATDSTNLYISDTLNNRILYLDNTNKIHLLLDESDGLNEPTGLYYNDTDKALYISNSGDGEILKYSSKNTITNPILTLSGVNANSINKIEISFFNQDGTNKNITGPTIKNDITFLGITKNQDYLGITNNKLKYYFVNYVGPNYSEPSCTGTEERLVGGNPVKCLNTGSGKTSNYMSKNFSISDKISINNIVPTFTNTGSYYLDLELLDSSNNIIYKNYYPYFTQGDDDLTTLGDNKLTTLYSGLNYPTGIWGTGATDLNIFGDSTYSDMTYQSTDKLLNLPVKNLDITNIPNDLLTIKLKYYKSYNCYNLDEKIEKTFIVKKNLK